MARPKTTLVWIAGEQLVRADGARGRLDVHAIRRPATDELALLVDAALRLGPPPGRRVFVLSDALWTQRADLPRAAVDGMPAAQVAAALAFEAEPMSGIPAADAAVGATPIAGDDPLSASYWIATAPALELATTDEVVGRLGARLAGVAHPAGLPRPLTGPLTGPATWSRLELWPDAAVHVSGNGAGTSGSPPALTLAAGAPLAAARREQLEAWWDACDDVLLAHGGMRLDGRDARALDDDPVRDRWLAAWLAALEDDAPLPLIRPPRRAPSAVATIAVAVVLWAVAGLACWMHHRDVGARRAASAPATTGSTVARQLATIRREVTTLQAEDDRAAPAALERARRRAATALVAIADSLPRGARIHSAELSGATLQLEGQAVGASLPNRLATALADRLPGWTVKPPTKHRPDGGRTWDFTLELTDGGAPPGGLR